MTICIAAACQNGERIVTATDSRLSSQDVVGECVLAKMHWFDDWQLMFSGDPARFGLIVEQIREISESDPSMLLRPRMPKTVSDAYRKVCSQFASFEFLSPFDMSVEEFKSNGLAAFGEGFHGELLRKIEQRATLFNDQFIVTGWGATPYAAMIYEIGSTGAYFHEASGFTAIGSGSQMAITMLMLLGQARHRSLAETIFNVACAKFSSEKSADLDVGAGTAMFVSRKRTEKEKDAPAPLGEFIDPRDIDRLRTLWQTHLKPRIPDEARRTINDIANKHGELWACDWTTAVNAEARMTKRESSLMAAEQATPESPKGGASGQPPSQE